MPESRIKRLEGIGFKWNVLDAYWDDRYRELEAFYKAHGHAEMGRETRAARSLNTWVNNQRQHIRKGRLDKERIAKLATVGVGINVREQQWERAFEKLRMFQASANGDWRGMAPALGSWCTQQREAYREGRLSKEQIERLEAIGFLWKLRDDLWEKHFANLVAFKAAFGHCDVPQRFDGYPGLGMWCSTQRERFARGRLKVEQAERLDAIGFAYDALESRWNRTFERLQAYRARFGHCNVQSKEDAELATWCSNQRGDYGAGRLSAARLERLESIGFQWNPIEERWQAMLEALTAFKATHGHCEVQRRANQPETERELASWIHNQRSRYRRGRMGPERVGALEAIGFRWERQDLWTPMFEKLRDYREKFGHCNVSRTDPSYGKLGIWSRDQRDLNRKGELLPERRAKLEAIGFCWDPKEARWQELFGRLKAFGEKEGHYRVPVEYKKDPELGDWLNRQKDLARAGKLQPERARQLSELGLALAFVAFPQGAEDRRGASQGR